MGSFTHFFGVMTGQAIGIPLEPVPYRGAAPCVADLQGGHIAAGCGSITDFLDSHRAGKVKVLFTSGAKRTTAAPDIPRPAPSSATHRSTSWAGMSSSPRPRRRRR